MLAVLDLSGFERRMHGRICPRRAQGGVLRGLQRVLRVIGRAAVFSSLGRPRPSKHRAPILYPRFRLCRKDGAPPRSAARRMLCLEQEVVLGQCGKVHTLKGDRIDTVGDDGISAHVAEMIGLKIRPTDDVG